MAGKRERQRKLARQRYQRQADRRAQRDRRTRQWTISGLAAVAVAVVVLGSIALAGGFSSPTPAAAKPAATSSPAPSASATPTPTPVSEPAQHCTYTAKPPAARKVGFPSARPDYKASYRATIHTNRGAVVIDLLNSRATCTVNSFVHLAEQKFFNHTPCPRLSSSQSLFILQCGDPTGAGTGGPGYEFASENLAGATYPAGTLAMANSGQPDSNGSQFFLVFRDSALPPSYTPFGRIVGGLNILQGVGKRGFGPPLNPAGGGKPRESVTIEAVTIKKT